MESTGCRVWRREQNEESGQHSRELPFLRDRKMGREPGGGVGGGVPRSPASVDPFSCTLVLFVFCFCLFVFGVTLIE